MERELESGRELEACLCWPVMNLYANGERDVRVKRTPRKVLAWLTGVTVPSGELHSCPHPPCTRTGAELTGSGTSEAAVFKGYTLLCSESATSPTAKFCFQINSVLPTKIVTYSIAEKYSLREPSEDDNIHPKFLFNIFW